MNFLFLAIGLIIGVAVGGAGAYVFLKKAHSDSNDMIEALSAKVVTKQAEQILQLAESKLSGKKDVIDGTLKNMKDELQKVEAFMRDLEKDRIEKLGKVDTRMDSAAMAIKDLSATADSLKRALAGNSIRGQWGERMAEDVLRLAGMVEGINYIKQTKLQDSGSRPDFTFILPQNQTVNMDVKFPFNNYQLYVEATSEMEKEKYKKDFIKDVKLRVKELQTRGYVNTQENTVDYVLLFIPNEQIFSFINEHAREVIDEALQGKTILCSPLSLYAILAVVRQSIDNFRMESKSQEMLDIIGTFHDQWSKFKDQMAKVKDRFASTQKEYDELLGTRTRQLDKPLEKIEEMRTSQGVEAAHVQKTLGKVAGKMTEGAETTL